MSKVLTQEEVQKHNSENNGVWIVIDGSVYDMSSLYFPSALLHANLKSVSMNIQEAKKF